MGRLDLTRWARAVASGMLCEEKSAPQHHASHFHHQPLHKHPHLSLCLLRVSLLPRRYQALPATHTHQRITSVLLLLLYTHTIDAHPRLPWLAHLVRDLDSLTPTAMSGIHIKQHYHANTLSVALARHQRFEELLQHASTQEGTAKWMDGQGHCCGPRAAAAPVRKPRDSPSPACQSHKD